ncbi:glycosyltransferase involved in cell wall biosynthesis [Aurantimicrobium minutum]|uniref:glycosyltransferase n=1 Tax=Aurantimicrobium minutum TaxID=708131 RepID=UPI002406CC4A|nr:glycosyltransferase [Aurantimicrobium minutum]MDF9810495.1 glycosyltransferase involved in cell wall biosynthesis [Aurantimicrobium minutum]
MTKSESPARILVVLPTLGDRLETLEETLQAIEEQRKEVSLRLVVVAPANAGEARELSRKYGADVVDDPKTGISAAINCGITARQGEEFYAWMGDDDLFRPGGLKLLLKLLDENPAAIVSYGACEYIDPTGKILATSKAGKLAQFLLPWGPDLIPHPGAMIRLNSLEAIGGFDTSLKYAMDLDAFLQLQKMGKFVCTTIPVSAFRWHPDSLTVANRRNSSLESEAVKLRYLPAVLRPIRFLWVYPIRWASSIAAQRVSKRS